MSTPAVRNRTLLPAERRHRILDVLRQDGSVSVGAVERLFGISPMTVRRDLAILADRGLAKRTHGGAVLPEIVVCDDPAERPETETTLQHERLAAAVVETVKPKETVFVDSSTPSYYAVREILDRGLAVTLLTNSLPVMSLVGSADARNVDVIGFGGNFHTPTRSFIGAETVRKIQSYFVDRLVFSAEGIQSEGFLTDLDPFETEVKRAMISRARQVILVATATKFDERGLSVIAPADRVHAAYLADPPAEGVRLFESVGARVYTC